MKPFFVENFLTPIGLAYWFMDDGGKASYNRDYVRKGIVLNTQGFTRKDVDILCQGLHTKFGFECWIKPHKNGYVLVISAQSYDLFMELCGHWIIPSMRHKLPHGTES